MGRNAQTDDSLSGGAVAQHVKYLRGMGQTALMPVLQNMSEWRRKHKLYTIDPETVLQVPDVFHQIDDKWAVRATATKKDLVLEGFQLMPEWADTVNGKMRTRVWITGRKADEDDDSTTNNYVLRRSPATVSRRTEPTASPCGPDTTRRLHCKEYLVFLLSPFPL